MENGFIWDDLANPVGLNLVPNPCSSGTLAISITYKIVIKDEI
jgi:hypothetical protein